eukprot:10868286-Alexandrium_andersonii.AAC.1
MDFAKCQGKKVKRGDIFSPTPGTAAARTLLARAAKNRKKVASLDFVAAFLHAELSDDEPTFVRPPKVVARQGYVWRLRKALYGLREFPQEFFNGCLKKVLKELGYVQMKGH